jgi:hypothetical protein
MCSIIAILLLVVSGLFGYSMVSSSQQPISPPPIVEIAPASTQSVQATAEALPLPTQVIACATQDSSQDLAQMTQVINAKVFEPALWTAQSDVNDQRTTTTWHSDKLGAVAYLEYLHFDCGVSQEQIDQYFTPETFQTIMSSYSSYQMTSECRHNGLRLFEFDASFNDTNYHVLYWIEQVTPTRVADITLTFPVSQQAKLSEYAGRLFPDLPTCQAASG